MKGALFQLRWTLVGVGVALALIVWLLLGDSDEERIRARIDELARAVGSKPEENMAFRALRLKSAFREALEPNVGFAAPELRNVSSRDELIQLAASAPRLFGEFDVSLDDTEIAINEPTQQATVLSQVTLTGISDRVKRDTRRVRFTLVEKDGDWRVSRIEVEAKAPE